MTEKQVESAGSGAGFFGLMGLMFIGLKLGGVIEWSWWYVTLPLWWWAPVVVFLLLIVWVLKVKTNGRR